MQNKGRYLLFDLGGIEVAGRIVDVVVTVVLGNACPEVPLSLPVTVRGRIDSSDRKDPGSYPLVFCFVSLIELFLILS